MHDIHSIAKAVPAIVPAVKTAAGEGSSIDVQGFGSLLFVINTGAIAGDGDFGVVVQDSANGSEWANVDDVDVQGAIPATLAATNAYRVGYTGSKRYVRLALTKAGGTSIALGAVAILGHPAVAPVA